jgi:hypothetical protein
MHSGIGRGKGGSYLRAGATCLPYHFTTLPSLPLYLFTALPPYFTSPLPKLRKTDLDTATAAFTSVASAEASAFLLSKPKLSTLKLSPLLFSTSLKLRLRIPVHTQDNLKCYCAGHSHVDQFGDHLAICKRGQQIYDIHNSMVQVVADLCRSNGLSVKVEPRNIFHISDPENNKRPDLEISGMHNVKVLGDVCVTYPVSQFTTHHQAKTIGYNADKQAKAKHRKYDESTANIGGAILRPFIFESRGFWHSEFRTLSNKLSPLAARPEVSVSKLSAYIGQEE